MLVFSGPTHIDQTQGVLNSAPQTLRVVNTGEEPLAIERIELMADWVTATVVPGSTPQRADATEGAATEFTLEQLKQQDEHHLQPGEDNAWSLRLYWDATHPDAVAGPVRLDLEASGPAGQTISRQLTVHAALSERSRFEGLFALDWGNVTIGGAYIPRDAFIPKPIPVLLKGGRSGGHHAAEVGTPASLYLGNVQDKYAPLLTLDEAAEVDALREGPAHVPNLIQNLKRTLAALPPYGGLTAADLDVRIAVEDEYSANSFDTPEYPVSHLARLLIENTMSALASQPRRRWDDAGRLLHLSAPLGTVDELILTYPPLLSRMLRTEVRRWFTESGFSVRGTHEWDDLTAIAMHALMSYVGERDGRLEAFVRRFGEHAEFVVADLGSTSTRLGRLAIAVTLGTPTPQGFRAGRIEITHRAVSIVPAFSGDRLVLAVFRLLKLKLAALLSTKLLEQGEPGTYGAFGAYATNDAAERRLAESYHAARTLQELIQKGELAALIAHPERAEPASVEQLLPTAFRKQSGEAPRRHFTLLTLLSRRVLEAFAAGATAWTPAVTGAGAHVLPLLQEAVSARFPDLELTEEDWSTLRLTAEELAPRTSQDLDQLARAIRELSEPPTRPARGSSVAARRDAQADAPEPWIVLAGAPATVPFVRETLIDRLTLRDEQGLAHVAPQVWSDDGLAAAAVALGAVAAEQALAAGLQIVVNDILDLLPCDIGLRTDRFVTLFERGMPVERLAHVPIPASLAAPIVLWYRFGPGDEPYTIHPLGRFESLPDGDQPLIVTLVPDERDGDDDGGERRVPGWRLVLSRGPYGDKHGALGGGVPLTPEPLELPLEHNLYSGIH